MQPNSFPFGKEVQSYRQAEVITPFQKQNQLFDKPIGQLVYKSYIWRVVFFCGVGFNFILTLILIAYFNTIPYKILVEQITNKGFLKSPPQILSPNYIVNEAVVAEFIKSMLLSVKGDKAYESFVDEVSWSILQAGLKSFNKTQMTQSVFKNFMINGNNFSVELVDKNNKAILMISGRFVHQPLETQKQVNINPLGIYIQKLTIQRL
ncbi:hypothetical protein [Fastidiosibacter lacustris]|uniref:hypothetical protein n=1 Tax=Fastidiosibacter lacustris TaxID=2056695 RepID=UPI000E353AE0|nr:hypothetical protein [Fastidiosibacter lacustris]